MVQYIYNNVENEKTKILPFFANYRYSLTIKELHVKESLSLSAMNNAKKLQSLHKQLRKNTKFVNKIIEKYYDKRYEDVLPWKEGDKVYLQRKNIQIK